MKGKPTWKPAGLKAKHWRTASQTRGAANLSPSTTLSRGAKPRWRVASKSPPYAQPAS